MFENDVSPLAAKVDALRAAVKHLPEKDHKFARDLIDAYQWRGYVSAKQEYWIEELTRRATPKPEAAQVGDLGRIKALLTKASETLKRPAIRFDSGAGDLKLSLAAPTSNNPGAVYVKCKGSYAGKVTPEGAFMPSRETSRPDAEAIKAALAILTADPEAAAKAYGQRTGNCCFCTQALTDPRSVAAGYGPICAAKWGLAWGQAGAEAEEPADLFTDAA